MITVCQMTCCAMAAYAFARLHFPGRNLLFFVVLAALMIPPIFTLLPNFIFVQQRGWLNTYIGIAAPALLMTPFSIFFLRQFFMTIPVEIEEAATIDGAGRFRTFFTIIVPMAMSAVVTLVGPHLHHRMERLPVAQARRHQAQRSCAHRLARELPVADAAGHPRLGRPDVGDLGVGPPDHDPAAARRQATRRLDPVHGDQVTAVSEVSAFAERVPGPEPAEGVEHEG